MNTTLTIVPSLIRWFGQTYGHCTAYVFGTPHHLEFIQVREVSLGEDRTELRAVDPEWDGRVQDMKNAFMVDDDFATTTLDGREYVVFMSPHGR